MPLLQPFVPNVPLTYPPLSDDDLNNAKKELISSSFPKINRRYIDKTYPGEPKFALFSYIESFENELKEFLHDIEGLLNQEQLEKSAKLQARKTIRGVAKIRGTFHTQQEAETRSEEIIREQDSSNSVFISIVGVPFPLISEGMAESVNEVNISEQVEQTISQNVRYKRQKEEQEMEQIKQRELELLEEAKKDPNTDDLNNYITQRVKLAHLRYAIDEHAKKRVECKENEQKCIKWLLDMSCRNPEFEEKFFEKYMESRKAAYIPEDAEMSGFLKYMNDPLLKLNDIKEVKEEDI